VILLALEEEGIPCGDGELATVKPVERGTTGDEDKFVEIVGVLDFSKIVLVGGFA
jgi:hypothetical protein